jgi:hypothetical protein
VVINGGRDARCGGKERKDWDLMQSLGAYLHVPDWQVEGKCPMEINPFDTWIVVLLHARISILVNNIANSAMVHMKRHAESSENPNNTQATAAISTPRPTHREHVIAHTCASSKLVHYKKDEKDLAGSQQTL